MQNEQVICTDCRHKLPIVRNQEDAEELIKRHFYGRVEVENASALLYFQKKGLTQHLIHRLKYRGDERISGFLGEWLAEILVDLPWSKDIEVIIPVPLHKKRKRKRGYNQVSGFAHALAERFGCICDEDILLKTFNSSTQALKNRFARTELKGTYFELQNSERITGKHILLVDDLITTGVTLETCVQKLLEGNPSKVSMATMAITV